MTNRKAIWLVALLMIVGGAFWFHEVQGKQTGESFTVMTFNVGTFNSEIPDMERIRQLIAETGTPEVLLLQEVPEGLQTRNLAERLHHIHQVFHPYPSGQDGLAIISRERSGSFGDVYAFMHFFGE